MLLGVHIMCIQITLCLWYAIAIACYIRAGQENRHHCKYFKKEIQHRKLGAYESIGRDGRKKVKKATTRFGFNSSFPELRSCCLLPLMLFTLLSGQETTARNW